MTDGSGHEMVDGPLAIDDVEDTRLRVDPDEAVEEEDRTGTVDIE